jgi:molecular chaperone GrpE
VSELQDRLLRLRADFDNYRKRTLKESSALRSQANEELAGQLLGVIDNLELGLRAAREHNADRSFVEGYELVLSELLGVLERAGLERIETVGREFDPNLHEAISHLPSPEHDEGIIMHEVRSGYRFTGRLLRAPQVTVSSGPPAAAPAAGSEA